MGAPMIKTMALTAVTAMLVGCGPNFGGSFRGTLSNAETCSDGSGSSVSAAQTFDITDRGGTLTLLIGGACDPFTAKAAGNSATLAAKACPDQSSGGVTVKQSLISGTLTLNEPNLSVSMSASVVFTSGGASLTCSDFITGTLVRQP